MEYAAYCEPHRPQFHFTPAKNWMNDPNGMVYFNGLYHLFYQYNPNDNVWGDIHWGHATSTDLVHWEHRPVALRADHENNLGYVFSGSCVVDWNNTSGLQAGEHPPLIALFTHATKENYQVQSLAYSTDGGDSWSMYDANPVLPNPGIKDFRDPKVFWDTSRERWMMVLAAGDRISFYTSANLIDWHHSGDFGEKVGAHGGVWECPDLFPLLDPRSGEEQWVLLVSMHPGAPNGGSGTQYFIGEFDGDAFVSGQQDALWFDYGPDNYAGVTWSDVPGTDGRRIFIGWMSNWNYANNVPTSPWRSAMTIPRELFLYDTEKGARLGSKPIAELSAQLMPCSNADMALTTQSPLTFYRGDENASKAITLKLENQGGSLGDWTLRFFNQGGDQLRVAYESSEQRLVLDRTHASIEMADAKDFMPIAYAPLEVPVGSELSLELLIDHSSLEIFVTGGQSLVSMTYFSNEVLNQCELISEHRTDSAVSVNAEISDVVSIWSNAMQTAASALA